LVFAQQFIDNGQFKTAIKMCNKALVHNPDNIQAKEMIVIAKKKVKTRSIK